MRTAIHIGIGWVLLLILLYCVLYGLRSQGSSGSRESFQPTLGPGSTSAELKFQFNGRWTVYYNDTKLKSGSPTGKNITQIVVPNINQGDVLRFDLDADGSEGGMIGEISKAGQSWVTGKTDFVCMGRQTSSDLQQKKGVSQFVGGKYIGCFGSKGTTMEKVGEKSFSDCQNEAVLRQLPYYAMTDGKNCMVGDSYATDSIAANAYFCGTSCSTSPDAGHISCGGPGFLQTYSALEAATIQERGHTFRIPRNSNINASAKWIFPYQSELDNAFPQGMWSFTWTNKSPTKIAFCGNTNYNEFNPVGCTMPSTPELCKISVLPNYIYDDAVCKTRYAPVIDYGSKHFQTMIRRAYGKFTEMMIESKKDDVPQQVYPWFAKQEEFLTAMTASYKAACELLSQWEDPTSHRAWCQGHHDVVEEAVEKACIDVPVDGRMPAHGIHQPGCKEGTLDCEILREQCLAGGHCFSSDSRPKCYTLPQKELVVDQHLNTPGFYEAIAKAAFLANTPKYKRGGVAMRFESIMKNLVKSARVAQYTPSDNLGCNCKPELKKDELTCYPC